MTPTERFASRTVVLLSRWAWSWRAHLACMLASLAVAAPALYRGDVRSALAPAFGVVAFGSLALLVLRLPREMAQDEAIRRHAGAVRPAPPCIRVVGFRRVGAGTYEVTTESPGMGRVTEEIVVRPPDFFAETRP